MKRTFSLLASPAMALLILVTSPLAMAGQKGGHFSGRSGSVHQIQTQNAAPLSGNLNGSSKGGGFRRIDSNQVLNQGGFNGKPRVTQVDPFPGTFHPGHGNRPPRIDVGNAIPINANPFPDQVFDPPRGGNGNSGNGSGGSGNGHGNGNGGHGNGSGNGHGHHHWPQHWGYCHNWYWDYGFHCPPVIPCSLPTVTYIPAPITVVQVQTESANALFSSLDAAGVDLLIGQVQLLEAGTAQNGPLVRVLIANQGGTDMAVTTRVALVALKDGPATADSPRVMGDVKVLRAGETTTIDLRLPATATTLPKLLVAVEVPKSVVDINEKNNLASGDFSQLTAVTTAMK